MNQYLGAGLTAFGLVGNRADDSMGIGSALSWLNKARSNRSSELMIQIYYQAKLITDIYLEPALSYIPTPGTSASQNPVWAGTVRAIVLF